MELRILGPLGADINGTSIVPTASKQRQILALLALYPGRVIPTTTLMEEIWGDQLPRRAHTTMQTYILHLRRRLTHALGPDTPTTTAKQLLATGHGGYLLHTTPQSVDVHEYNRLTTLGQHAFDQGHDEQAAHTLRHALTLWQGPALLDVRTGPVLTIETMRLEESRLVTLERRIDADLRLGRHTQVLAELTQLTAQHPHHEGLHSQAMVAHYRSGRQNTALNTYHRLRHHLINELGIEPTPHLQRLHHAILTVDPNLHITAGPRHTSTFNLYAA
ncbi:BTAD domain-containing putative transcriptional regulator [Kitasatospora sp. NPDC058170]|uniref:AfsR/SARP family transcriptional regulator n=1 Tax=Kitasatospora sp. NPDC058170 TaxID=3346364 RepID=UPI0036DC4A73